MASKPVVIRKENFGLLIWSPKHDSYFIPDEIALAQIPNIVQSVKEEDNAWKDRFDSNLVSDLTSMGLDRNVRFIDNSLEGRLSAPLDVYCDYTNACNLRCPYCYNKNVDRNITMPEDKIIRVLTQMSNNGIMRTHLAGGEPMINIKGFETYLRTSHEVGMNASVNCNGTLVTERAMNAVFDYGIITLTFSLDGPNATVHDSYRGAGNFYKTRENARLTAQEKKIGHGPKLQYKAVHMFDTPLEVYDGLIEVAIADGMDRMQFHNPECSIYHPKGHYSQPDIIKGYYERVLHLVELREKYKGQIDVWGLWNPITGCADIGLPGYHGCIGGQELVAIDAKGTLKPCLMNKYELGNLFGDWDGDFAMFWRESKLLLEYQRFADTVDPHCEYYSKCRGGRKTRVIVENRDGLTSNEPIKMEDMQGFDPYCTRDFIQNSGIPPHTPSREYHLLRHKRINMAHSL